jgi:dGTPase
VADRADVPLEVAQALGTTNGSIVYRLVEDLLKSSSHGDRSYRFSEEVGGALKALKDFNREHIYYNKSVKKDSDKIRRLFRIFFESFTEDFSNPHGPGNRRLQSFLKGMDKGYLEETSPAEKARDFIAGMTDDFFRRMAEEILIPAWSAA